MAIDWVQKARSNILRWRASPLAFVRELFGIEPDGWQRETLEALPRNMRMALKACKGPGKSAVLSWVLWWFLVCFPHPKVVAISITAANLRDGLWTEAAKWQAKSEFLKSRFTWTAERIFSNDHPRTWWAAARAWSQTADASQQADALAGVHADHVLFLVDEAGGIPDAVVATAEAGLANADAARGTTGKLIIAGNPTELSGPLYRACTRERPLWWVKEISSAPDDPNRTPRVPKAWAQQQIDKYGWDHPWVLINVRGEFPPGQSNALIGVEDANKAGQRTILEATYRDAARILGVDVARFGDDRTVLFRRQGRVAHRPVEFRGLDTMAVADQVAREIDDWKPDAVFVDQTGVGAGVVDRLRQLGHSIIGVDNGSSALAAHPKLQNRRCEMWWALAEWIRSGGCIPDDAELISELTAPVYFFDKGGRLCLESKADLKARGLPSPDKGDALALTFAAPVARRFAGVPGGGRKHVATTEYDPLERSA